MKKRGLHKKKPIALLLNVYQKGMPTKQKMDRSLRKVKKLFTFLKESVVYPFVASEQKSGKLFISNEMIVKILSHVKDNRLSPI